MATRRRPAPSPAARWPAPVHADRRGRSARSGRPHGRVGGMRRAACASAERSGSTHAQPRVVERGEARSRTAGATRARRRCRAAWRERRHRTADRAARSGRAAPRSAATSVGLHAVDRSARRRPAAAPPAPRRCGGAGGSGRRRQARVRHARRQRRASRRHGRLDVDVGHRDHGRPRRPWPARGGRGACAAGSRRCRPARPASPMKSQRGEQGQAVAAAGEPTRDAGVALASSSGRTSPGDASATAGPGVDRRPAAVGAGAVFEADRRRLPRQAALRSRSRGGAGGASTRGPYAGCSGMSDSPAYAATSTPASSTASVYSTLSTMQRPRLIDAGQRLVVRQPARGARGRPSTSRPRTGSTADTTRYVRAARRLGEPDQRAARRSRWSTRPRARCSVPRRDAAARRAEIAVVCARCVSTTRTVSALPQTPGPAAAMRQTSGPAARRAASVAGRRRPRPPRATGSREATRTIQQRRPPFSKNAAHRVGQVAAAGEAAEVGLELAPRLDRHRRRRADRARRCRRSRRCRCARRRDAGGAGVDALVVDAGRRVAWASSARSSSIVSPSCDELDRLDRHLVAGRLEASAPSILLIQAFSTCQRSTVVARLVHQHDGAVAPVGDAVDDVACTSPTASSFCV